MADEICNVKGCNEVAERSINIKKVEFADDLGAYMNFSLKPNFKVAGPVLGGKIKEFAGMLAKANPADFMGKESYEVELSGETVEVTNDMLDVRIDAKEGFSVVMENNVFIILDTTLTEDLINEGLAREVVSKVQQLRKQKDFDMMDNITIYLHADDEVAKAVEMHKDYKETLAVAIEDKEDAQTFKINGHVTGIDVEKM